MSSVPDSSDQRRGVRRNLVATSPQKIAGGEGATWLHPGRLRKTARGLADEGETLAGALVRATAGQSPT